MKPRLSAQRSSSYANICNHTKQVINSINQPTVYQPGYQLTPQRQTWGSDARIKEEPSDFKMLYFGSDGHRRLWWRLKFITQYEVAQGNHHTQSEVRKRKKEHLEESVLKGESLQRVRLVTDFCEHASSHAESHEQARFFCFLQDVLGVWPLHGLRSVRPERSWFTKSANIELRPSFTSMWFICAGVEQNNHTDSPEA